MLNQFLSRGNGTYWKCVPDFALMEDFFLFDLLKQPRRHYCSLVIQGRFTLLFRYSCTCQTNLIVGETDCHQNFRQHLVQNIQGFDLGRKAHCIDNYLHICV